MIVTQNCARETGLEALPLDATMARPYGSNACWSWRAFHAIPTLGQAVYQLSGRRSLGPLRGAMGRAKDADDGGHHGQGHLMTGPFCYHENMLFQDGRLCVFYLLSSPSSITVAFRL